MSDDSSFESDGSQHYTHKIRHTNQLIDHLETKLQSYIKQGTPEPIDAPVFSFHTTEQQLKSKMELEREVREFDQRMKKYRPSQSMTTFPSQEKQRTQEASIPIEQSHTRFENLMRIENQSQSDRPNLYESEASSRIYKQQEQILQNINEKLNRLQRQDEDECVEIEAQIAAMQEQQMELLDERNNVLEEQNELQKALNDLQLAHQQMLKKTLHEDQVVILSDQQKKIKQIKTQSEQLIKQENVKKRKIEIELELIEKEKQQLLQGIEACTIENNELVVQKDDITVQLNGLIHLHNQMLQTDLRKTINSIQNTPSQSRRAPSQHEESAQSKQVVSQIEFLYKLNVQLKETMEQQMQSIHNELNEQRHINAELLSMLRSREVPQQVQQVVPPQAALSQTADLSLQLQPKYGNRSQKASKIDLKSIKVQKFEEMLTQLKSKHKLLAKRNKSIPRIPKPKPNPQETFNRAFQDQIFKLNEMVADQLSQIKA